MKYMLNHSWNYTWILCYLFWNLTLHCVSFPRWCLTISKNCSIKSLNYTIHYRWGCILINLFLSWFNIKYSVIVKFRSILWIFNLWRFNSDWHCVKKLMNMRSSQCFLSLIYWSESTNNFNISYCSNFL